MNYKRILMSVAMMFAVVAAADVQLGSPFADGMVLQRDMDVCVWGTADAGEKVKVSFAGNEVEGVADESGAWSVKLPKMAASKEGRELTVMSVETKVPITISDVLVGEVWFASGQSNCEMPLVSDDPHFSDRNGRLVAAMTNNPYIRFVYASVRKTSETPKRTADYPITWKKFTTENLSADPSFSALAVYFALDLYTSLDIPVGIVGSYWRGTCIEGWIPPDTFRLLNPPRNKEPRQQPTVLWNEMVAPWCPMTIRGLIWYQGCGNAGDGDLYREKMHMLYDGWSKHFENPDLQMFFAQLAPYSCSWWDIQQAQTRFAAEEKNAWMATTCDVGNNADIHPADKRTVAKRLAALALRHTYGFDSIAADAPTVKGVCSEEGSLILSFDGTDELYCYKPDWGVDYGFEIAGEDGKWRKAFVVNANNGARKGREWRTNGKVSGRDFVLEADGVEKPMKVRYLFSRPWTGTVYSSGGIPLGPFEAEVIKR